MGRFAMWLVGLGIVMTGAMPLEAQEVRLFDRFNLKLEGSWVRVNTEMRIDSESLGQGSTLNFEDDLGLGENQMIPSAAFEWQSGRKHRWAFRWQDIDRNSNQQVLEEIQIGDEIIPIDSNVGLVFEIESWAVDYTYYPWIKEQWAAGFGFGLRILDIVTVFTADDLEVQADGSVTAPLPYFNFEYRRLFGERWRMKAGLGWLAVSIQDISGGQWIGRVSAEHQTFNNVGFGLGLNFSTVNASAQGDEFRGAVVLDIHDMSLFLRWSF